MISHVGISLVKAVIPCKEIAIVGGYARDMFFGLPPKDIDVIVVVDELYGDEQSVFLIMKKLSRMFSREGIKSAVLQAYGQDASQGEIEKGSFSDRLYGDLCVNFDDFKVDFLFTKRPSVLLAMEEFDCSINKFQIGVSGQPEYVGTDKFSETGLVFKTESRISINEARRERMKTKYEQIKEVCRTRGIELP